ncbi:hypothetical protein PMAYCL1PPCAC_28449, partial [Pristionchus mayeri]
KQRMTQEKMQRVANPEYESTLPPPIKGPYWGGQPPSLSDAKDEREGTRWEYFPSIPPFKLLLDKNNRPLLSKEKVQAHYHPVPANPHCIVSASPSSVNSFLPISSQTPSFSSTSFSDVAHLAHSTTHAISTPSNPLNPPHASSSSYSYSSSTSPHSDLKLKITRKLASEAKSRGTSINSAVTTPSYTPLSSLPLSSPASSILPPSSTPTFKGPHNPLTDSQGYYQPSSSVKYPRHPSTDPTTLSHPHSIPAPPKLSPSSSYPLFSTTVTTSTHSILPSSNTISHSPRSSGKPSGTSVVSSPKKATKRRPTPAINDHLSTNNKVPRKSSIPSIDCAIITNHTPSTLEAYFNASSYYPTNHNSASLAAPSPMPSSHSSTASHHSLCTGPSTDSPSSSYASSPTPANAYGPLYMYSYLSLLPYPQLASYLDSVRSSVLLKRILKNEKRLHHGLPIRLSKSSPRAVENTSIPCSPKGTSFHSQTASSVPQFVINYT